MGNRPLLSRRSASRESQEVRIAAVLGLGRFGSALATELATMGVEVLGVDADADVVQEHDRHLTHVVRADASRADVLEQLGVADADRVVVAVGGHLEVSVLACSHLLRMGVPDVWAKAESEAHAQILDQLRVPHVVRPERETGMRVAHRIVDRAEDWVDYGHDLTMGRFLTPPFLLHRTAADAHVADRFGVRLIARRSAGKAWEYVTPQMHFLPDDQLIVAGTARELERFGRGH